MNSETGQGAGTSWGSVWLLVLVFGAYSVPPIFVSHSTMPMRISWFAVVASFGLVGAVTALAVPRKDLQGWRENNYQAVLGWLILVLFWMSNLLPICFLNFTGKQGTIVAIEKLVVGLVYPIFPVIRRYATDMAFPLDEPMLLKMQAVFSLMFLIGIACTVLTGASWALRSTEERKRITKITWRYQRYKSPWVGILAVPFGFAMGAAGYFGWIEFGADFDASDCIMNANCYAKDDLMIIAAAFTKMFVVFGMPFGSLLLLQQITVGDQTGPE
jgi:hypothetical protein